MTKVRHVLGISGGKDSSALAIYMNDNYHSLDIDFYSSDTGKELDETYQLIENLKTYLGKDITILEAFDKSHKDPFDHYLTQAGGFLPSSRQRWCTQKLKLEPFESFVENDPVVSYVGIRGDENREGYISRKPNIQSIFPFRRNIWSEDVTTKLLVNSKLTEVKKYYQYFTTKQEYRLFENILNEPISRSFNKHQKLSALLDLNVKIFNKVVFEFLKTTNYPLGKEAYFPLIENDEILVKEDIFRILEDSGVGVPAYYNKIDFEVNGKKGQYARSRSGCFFCFFQQKIEWVWLYEQHPEKFKKAIAYEKDGYTWNENESLEELTRPERIEQIKEEYIAKTQNRLTKSNLLLDILADDDSCMACFV